MSEVRINYPYNVFYAFGDVSNAVGCQTEAQAHDICEALTLLVDSKGEEMDFMNIEDAETGEVKMYPVGRKIELED